MTNNYQEKKKLLQSIYINNLKKGLSVKFVKKTSNLFRKKSGELSKNISIDDFNEVIDIDKKNLTATVEAMITHEKLVDDLYDYGYIPVVVPQLKTITLGGAISGVGIEASSFKYGLVHESVLEMEVMLPDGKIVNCTPNNEHKDLFYSIPNSYGTLGYILKAKIKIIPAKSFVKLSYFKYTEPKQYFMDLKKYCNDKRYDYIDGVIFSNNLMYIIASQFVKTAPYASNYKFINVFYKSILKNKTDYLTTKDFIWRWDTDWFWCSKIFYMQNKFLRFLFGKFILGSRKFWRIARFEEKHKIQEKIQKFFKVYQKTESVVQDVAIPIENCVSFLDFFNKNIGILPIWICPTKAFDKKAKYPLFDLDPNKLFVDFGFWDTVKSNKQDGYYNKLIEDKVEKLKGHKSLYSTSFYNKDNFWQIYSYDHYKKIKSKYDPKNIKKDLYTKCVLNK